MAGQFWPQGHNLNKIGKGPLDDVIYQIWKLSAKKFHIRRFIKVAFLKPIFRPWPTYSSKQNHFNYFARVAHIWRQGQCDLLMQPTGTIWTTLVGDHHWIIPQKFGQNPVGCKDVRVKMLTEDKQALIFGPASYLLANFCDPFSRAIFAPPPHTHFHTNTPGT